ncbi:MULTISPECIES: chemotaxis protein CheB [unclassified Nonomuraea]|uniref:chemotaxis protein CheB n=1 Tax=unclassified Nonomuraea TaxID=2593643 RepID=UPI0033F450A9
MSSVETAQARNLVVVAASAGGVEPLRALAAGLPAGLEAAVLVVLHVSASGGSVLAGILDRAGPLKAAPAEDGAPVVHGEIRVAVPDHHLLVRDGHVRLSRGPRYNGHRPAADLLFMSAAMDAGPRVSGIVLSGTLGDGARGCAVIERRGGAVAVQDPAEADFEGMPSAALAATRAARVLPLAGLADWAVQRSSVSVVTEETMPETTPDTPDLDAEMEQELARYLSAQLPETPKGELSGFTCPECNGPLYASRGAPSSRYTCRVGHSWSMESMVSGQAEAVERALWIAILRLEERLRLLQRMIHTAEERGHRMSARRLVEEADETEEALRTIQGLQARVGTGEGLVEA